MSVAAVVVIEDVPTPPTAAQRAAFEHLLAHGGAVRDAVVAALIAHIRTRSGATLAAADVQAVAGLEAVCVRADARDGFAFVGFEIRAEWGAGHRFGVLTHQGRVVEVGPAEAAWGAPPGEYDERDVPTASPEGAS